jgi:hypothetical protein
MAHTRLRANKCAKMRFPKAGVGVSKTGLLPPAFCGSIVSVS